MIHYRDWTARQVRDFLIEGAKTTRMLHGGHGPREFGNSMPTVVREAWKDAAPMTTTSRPIPSSHALARMEMVWGWINALPREADRRLLYEWSEAKALGRGYLARVMERNDTTERTLRHAVTRICQGIANSLNRKHEIRLTMPVDEPAGFSDPVHDFDVRSAVRVARQPRHTAPTEKLTNDSSPEAVEARDKHMARVMRSRKNRAKRAAERAAKRKRGGGIELSPRRGMRP